MEELPDRIQQAMADEGIEHYSMSLTDDEEIEAVIEAVNVGIDAHLTACNYPDRGDSYQHGDRSITATSDTDYWKTGDKMQLARTLECNVSAESLPVLLRRLDDIESEAARRHGAFAVPFSRRSASKTEYKIVDVKLIWA